MILSFTCNGLTRRIQRLENAVVAVRQDSNVDTVRMIFRPEEYNNINLASVSVKFLYVDTNGEIKAYQTGTTPDSGVYVADWELTDDVVDDAGYINFAVKLAVVNGDAVEKQWFSIPDTFRVYDSVDDTNNPPGETAAEQATNAEKIAQLQSQLGTATSELEGLTSTVARQGAELDTIVGRVIRQAILANADLDSITAPGFYSCVKGNASSILNKPSGVINDSFVLNVYQVDGTGSQVMQEYISTAAGGYHYVREKATTWSAWSVLHSVRTEPIAISSNTDLNTLTDVESYRVTTNAVAKTLTNKPTDLESAFIMDVRWSRTTDVKMQVIYEWNGEAIYIRSISKGTSWADATFGNWVKQPTRAEMDALTWTALPSGADLNDYTTPGRYYTTTKAETENIVNKPSGMQNPLTLEVQKRGAYCTQVLYDYYGALYTRATITSGWTQWFKYEGVQVS